jgi:hypothetical protein
MQGCGRSGHTSVDAKKKENIGNFKNNGTTYQPQGNPIKVLNHDVPLKELRKVTPLGGVQQVQKSGFRECQHQMRYGRLRYHQSGNGGTRRAWKHTTLPMKSSSPPIAMAVTITETDFGNMNCKGFPMRLARK